MYTNIFSFGERTLSDYQTDDVGLSNSMVLSMKLRCYVNHWRDIVNCSCKWFCFSNSYRCIGPKSSAKPEMPVIMLWV